MSSAPSSPTSSPTDTKALQDEIADLEARLHAARARLATQSSNPSATSTPSAPLSASVPTSILPHSPPPALHALLLLADSALPLGSFAFSSGLESYLAHHKPYANKPFAQPRHPNPNPLPSPSPDHPVDFPTFLRLSLASLSRTSLPYVIAGYLAPERLPEWDNDLDASTPCVVARRASVAQGRALVVVWERSFGGEFGRDAEHKSNGGSCCDETQAHALPAVKALVSFAAALRTPNQDPQLNAHLSPLWGATTRALSLDLRSAAFLFLFAHARTITSAAVRASVMGPYQAQSVLAGRELRGRIWGLVGDFLGGVCEGVDGVNGDSGIKVELEVDVDEMVRGAGQCVPVLDLWVGRHEKLYSRIFNS